MKKYIFFIIGIGIILAGLLIFNVYTIQKENTKIFKDTGYILESANSETQKVDKYYFNADEEYRIKNNQKVIFKDTSGDEVTTGKDNFIHFNNGSISSLQKGVLINLENIDQDPITYYSIAANQLLTKQGDNYSIDHLGGKLQFTNLIWKISDTKYLVAGNGMTVTFDDGTTKEINGYIELEYLDNQIIKIYNQEIIYQTISSKVNLKLSDNIEINLQSKAVSKNGETKMNLANMVIDSDDNIEIQEEPEGNTNDQNVVENEMQNEINSQQSGNTENSNNENNNEGNSGNTGNAGNQGETAGTQGNNGASQGEDTTNAGTTAGNEGTGVTTGGDTSTGGTTIVGGSESVVEDLPELVAPVYKVESFDVDSISLNAKISIKDDESRLVRNSSIKILENSTGKTVYAREEPMGTYNIDVSVSTLTPDTDYTLVIESAYDVDGITYTKNFVYKIFRTKTVGITFEKEVFTNTSLKFKISVDTDSKVKSAQLSLVSATGTIDQTYTVGDGTASGSTAEFIGLQPDTEYTIKLTNVLYDGQIISNGFEQEQTFRTLKDKPNLGIPEYEIDKRNSTFTLKINDVEDPNNGIQGYRYEIYDARTGLDQAPVYTKEVSSKQEIVVNVDEKVLFRGVPYTFKVIALFNDNEKIVEYESNYSDVMKMDGVAFPTVRFEKETITFERIQGKLIIEDPNNTISTDENNSFIITYTDSTGYTRQFTYKGGLTIPIDINDLRSNETYKLRIYTTVDLKDDNDPIDECYIGGAIIQTLSPGALVGSFVQDNSDTRNTFNLTFQLKRLNGDDYTGSIDTINQNDDTLNDLEAKTLSNLEFRIYAGQPLQNEDGTVSMPDTPIRTVKIKDEYAQDPYSSKIKEDYYDKSKVITPEFFGAENKDFKDQKYTIQVLNAYDYTYNGGNEIPLVKGLGYDYYVITANGYIPDYPTETDKAIDVLPIRNRDTTHPREDLDSQTIVGYNVQAKYDNSQNYAKKVVYNMIDKDTGKIIATQELDVGTDGVIPSATFNIGDGTPYGTQDTDQARRGNNYYFTYKVYLDLNHDEFGETEWPLPSDNVTLKSEDVTPQKQQPRIIMYPSTSTENTITYKYKCLDVDHALEVNELSAYIDNTKKNSKTINANTGNMYDSITFENLAVGNLEIRTSMRTVKTNPVVEEQLAYQYFEGVVDISDLKYKVNLEENSTTITISGDASKLERIVAVKAIFTDTETRTIVINKDLEKVTNNMLTISFNDISDLLDKETEVTVEAYYDTGVTGYDVQSDYVAYQKAYKNGEQINYYAINNEGNLVPTTTINSNMFSVEKGTSTDNTTETFSLRNPMDGSSATLNLNYSENGYKYQNDVMLQKQIGTQSLAPDGNNIIKFNLIIPGISLVKDGSTSELDIVEELDRVQLNAVLVNKDSIEIKDNVIIAELWKTDENLSNSEHVRDIEIPIEDFKKSIIITGLEPKTYYYVRFKTAIRNTSGSQDYQEIYLYDVDADTIGRYYYFSTLANVNVDNINVVYEPKTYNDKDLKITYTLDKVLGYQKLRHIIYRWNDETQDYTEEIANFEDDLPKSNMEEYVDINPGSKFTFGTKYKIVITPIAMVSDDEGGQKELDLGTKEYEFYLEPLEAPLVGINGYRQDTVKDDGIVETGTKIRFTVTMYDNDRITVNDKYTIKIYNQNHEEITPEEYKVEYSTNDVNREFILENVARDQSYTLEVNLDLDYTNDGQEPYTHDNRNIKVVEPVNESGISVGNITTRNNATETNKIDLLFYNSYKISEIKYVKYSIYNTSGYNQSDTEEFKPTLTTSITDNANYYSFTLDKNLPTEGRYYVELQFLNEQGEIVDTASLEHIYIDN